MKSAAHDQQQAARDHKQAVDEVARESKALAAQVATHGPAFKEVAASIKAAADVFQKSGGDAVAGAQLAAAVQQFVNTSDATVNSIAASVEKGLSGMDAINERVKNLEAQVSRLGNRVTGADY